MPQTSGPADASNTHVDGQTKASAEDHALALRPNALSCVLQATAADGTRLLLAGDIEAAQEAALVERAQRGAISLRSEILLVPHHGSRTSSTPAFLDAVQPKLALVQAAYRSRFGHPAPDVLERYEQREVRVIKTFFTGHVGCSRTSIIKSHGGSKGESNNQTTDSRRLSDLGTAAASIGGGNKL